MSPRVTVLMTVYNGARYLDAAVQSILCQTFGDFELLIVDDGSTDETAERLAAYHDPRVRVVRTENRGLGAALRLGVELAAGELIARMDADDISAPNRLERQVAALEAMPEVGVLDAGAHLMDRQGRPLPDEEPESYASGHERRWRLLWRNVVTHPTVMMRRELLRRTGENYAAGCLAEDFDLWSRLLPHAEFHRLPERLLWYRRHSESYTARLGSPHFQHLAGILRVSLERLTGWTIGADLAADLAFLTRQSWQRPEDYVPRSSTDALIEVMARAHDSFFEKNPAAVAEQHAIRAEAAELLLDWAWLLDRCREQPAGGTRALALAALSYRPGAVFSGRFARHLVASAIGPRGLDQLRRALNR